MKKSIVSRTVLILFCTALIICCANFPVSAATPPQPTYGAANVDGDISEWNLAEDGSGDFFAYMYRSANSNKKVESKLYLRYDCSTNTLYALVLAVPGVDVIVIPEEAFIKIDNMKLVDDTSGDNGTPPDFAWYNLSGSTASGWEASASLTPGNYTKFDVHTQVEDDGEGETSAVKDRKISLEINCEPTAVDLLNFVAETNSDGSVTLQWETATEIDNTGFNIYRARSKDGRYKKMNDELIPAGEDAVSGVHYSFEDVPPASGTYYYKLEDIDMNGVNTMHGPVKVRVRGGGGEARRRS